MLAAQMAAPNSPQWFNTGLHWAYGIDGPAQGHYFVDHATGEVAASQSAYERPQPHACFIQSIADDLVNEGGIMDLWVREARLFKYGSGSGTNFSSLRGENEPLSGGGKSSGLMSFLKIGDRAAGAIKSGGTTRRAAKMVVVDIDHPDIEHFIGWKVREEQKVARAGRGLAPGPAPPRRRDGRLPRRDDRRRRGAPRSQAQPGAEARHPRGRAGRCCRRASSSGCSSWPAQGEREIDFPVFDTDWDSEAYLHRRRPERQQQRARDQRLSREGPAGRRLGADPPDRRRVAKRVRARALWHADRPMPPGAAPIPACSTTPPSTSGTPARPSGRINASNPCSEYMFLDDTACNLASLNLLTFQGDDGSLDVERLRARRPAVDHRPRDLGDDGAVPVAADRPALLRVPHPGPGLRQHRRLPDGGRHRLRLRPRRATSAPPSPR